MRTRGVVASALIAFFGVVGVTSAASGPTGNRQAIVIARSEAHGYARLAVETYRETGFIEMTDLEGKAPYFYFNWAQPALTAGWVWATEHGVVALSHGRVVWWRDDLTPPPCTGSGACHQVPVELVSDGRGAFYAFGSATSHTCFGRLTGSQPVDVGALWNRVRGHFSAPVFAPGAVKLTYTYPWGGRQTARETDTLSARTHLETSGEIVIPGGHTIRFRTGHPGKAPKAPTVNLCTP